jgi:hypothetical protein
MKFICFFLLLTVTGNLIAQEPTDAQCKQFHIGVFHYKGARRVTITRDSLYQVERRPNGKYVKASITWTSPCTYELRLVDTNIRSQKKLWARAGILVVSITAVDNDSYRYSAVWGGLGKVRGTIIKKT